MSELSSEFIHALEAERESINQRYRWAVAHGSDIERNALFEFLQTCVEPVATSVATTSPERVRQVVSELLDMSFALFGSPLLSNDYRSPLLERLWQEVLAGLPRLIAAQPNLIAGRLNNALTNFVAHPGSRPNQWLDLLSRAASRIENRDELFGVSLVAAWMSGLAQYRDSAIAELRTRRGLALGRLLSQSSDLEETSWSRAVERLAENRWLSFQDALNNDQAASQVIVRQVACLGDFAGFGGRFRYPPKVVSDAGNVYVSDSVSAWQVLADRFGSCLVHSDKRLPRRQQATYDSHDEPTIEASGQVTWGDIRQQIDTLQKPSSSAFDGQTLVVTLPTSYRLYLLARVELSAAQVHQ